MCLKIKALQLEVLTKLLILIGQDVISFYFIITIFVNELSLGWGVRCNSRRASPAVFSGPNHFLTNAIVLDNMVSVYLFHYLIGE